MPKIEEFFARYEEGANSFGTNSFDPELVCSQYTTEFMDGGPDGVACGRNDQALREATIQRHSLFQQIGFKRAKILHVDATPLDDRYTMAKIHWHMTFEKQPGHLLDFKTSL